MMTISVIVGSTRQGRFSEKPAQWILQQLHKREGIEAQLLDLRDFPMPFFDQPVPPAMPGRPPYEHDVVNHIVFVWRPAWHCRRHGLVEEGHREIAEIEKLRFNPLSLMKLLKNPLRRFFRKPALTGAADDH